MLLTHSLCISFSPTLSLTLTLLYSRFLSLSIYLSVSVSCTSCLSVFPSLLLSLSLSHSFSFYLSVSFVYFPNLPFLSSLLFSLLPFFLSANQSHAASPRAGGNKGDDATGETVRVQEDVPYGAVQYVRRR